MAPIARRPVLRGALTDASALVQQAVAGVHVRGEQDDMLRREAALPGFGGFYIDDLDHMVVYMKTGSSIPAGVVRRELVRAYANRQEPRIRSLMPEVARARIVPGDFSLSELISFENRISQSTVRIPGFTGIGTSLMKNRVVVGFLDAGDVEMGMNAIESLGIPSRVVIPEVWGPITVASSFDQADPVRPTRGGLMIEVHNSTQYPWTNGVTYVQKCSLNFNVRWYPQGQSTGTDYMMTASHCANAYRGINGVTGDTIFQPRYPVDGSPPLTNAAGFVTVNPPWQGPGCGVNPGNGVPVDYCINGDVMLIAPAPGVTMDRRLATSTIGGYNGQPGLMKINNYYPITSVVTPEWISARAYGVAKSAAITGTTSGDQVLPRTVIYGRMCWTVPNNCPTSPSSGGVEVAYYNVVKVAHAGWGIGDSGGVVFAGNSGGGSPYVALGILVAGEGGLTKFSNEVTRCNVGTGCAFYYVPWAEMEQSISTVLGSGTLNPATTQ